PAHAGMVRMTGDHVFLAGGRPRARGDGPSATRAGSATTSSAPRTRGWSYPADRTMLVFHLGPAHAGMVHASFGWHDKKTSRPRARGDGPSASRPWWSLPGSAPRARGWSRRRFGGVARAPVGPAHAGM